MTYFLKKWCWESEKINIQNYVAYAQNFAKTFPSALVLFCLLINFDIFITGYYFLDQGTCIMQSFVLSYSNLLYVFSKLLELAITIPGIYVSIKTIGSAEKITFMVFEYACRCNFFTNMLIELHVHV